MPPQEVAEVAVREADTCSQSRFFQYPVQCPLHGGFGALPQAARCGVEVFGAVAVHRLGQRGHVFFGGFADVPAVSSHARGYLPSYGLLGGGVYFVEEAVEAVSVEVAQRFVADALVQHGACHVGFRGVVEGVYVHFPGSGVVPSFGALHTCADGGIGMRDAGGGGVYDYFFVQGCGGSFCRAADACALLRGLRRPAGGVGVLFFEEPVELLLQLPALLRVSGGVEARPRVADSEAQDRGCGAGFARSRGGAGDPGIPVRGWGFGVFLAEALAGLGFVGGFAAHEDGGVVCGAGVVFIGYLHFVGVAEFFLHPFFEFGFGESFLVSADGAVGAQHEDFGGVVESTAGLSFFALVYDAFCPADVDEHFAAGFKADGHVAQHVAAPVFGQDI